MQSSGRWFVLGFATAAFALCAATPWHAEPSVRRAAGIVAATLILWISEIAPLGIIALGIPIAATLSGILTWDQAVAAWGDPVVFLFAGAFLLARALEKHEAFDWLLRFRNADGRAGGRGAWLVVMVIFVSGALSTVQNNTAVTAMLLPAVLALSRQTAQPALALLALSYGSTFGGTATPIGTAPNFIGYAEMRKIAPEVSFVSWLAVGLPVWIGTTAIGCGVLMAAGSMFGSATAPRGRHSGLEVDDSSAGVDLSSGPVHDRGSSRAGRRAALLALLVVAGVWLTVGFIKGVNDPGSALFRWLDHYVPESMPPILAACFLFLIPSGGRDERGGGPRTVLERRDLHLLDWDTLFLIAGGLCLGSVLRESGAARALADQAAHVQMQPFMVMLALGAVTLLLSELTSNTATASLMVPVAAALGGSLGIPPVKLIMLVALCASLGFALPVSTPPNAIVYGTRLVPLRLMAGVGVVVDVLCLVWVVLCVSWLG